MSMSILSRQLDQFNLMLKQFELRKFDNFMKLIHVKEQLLFSNSPHSSGATHARAEWLHIVVLGVIEVVVVVIIIVLPHHLDLSLQVVPEVSIDTFCLAALAHFFTGEKNGPPPPSLV